MAFCLRSSRFKQWTVCWRNLISSQDILYLTLIPHNWIKRIFSSSTKDILLQREFIIACTKPGLHWEIKFRWKERRRKLQCRRRRTAPSDFKSIRHHQRPTHLIMMLTWRIYQSELTLISRAVDTEIFKLWVNVLWCEVWNWKKLLKVKLKFSKNYCETLKARYM